MERVTMKEQHKTLAHTFATILNTRDLNALDGLLASTYINHNPFVADGIEANKQFWHQWLQAFPDTHVTVEDIITDGDRLVGRFTYRGTHHGSLMGEAATGRAIMMSSIDIWRVQDGKFVEHWDELNTLQLFQQLGLVPAPTEEARR
jgi:predicted ester cyclase